MFEEKIHETISVIIFVSALIILLLITSSIIFPSYLLVTIGGYENYAGINPLQIGYNFNTFVIINSIILGLSLFYSKNKLPEIFTKLIHFMLNFEISKRMSYGIIMILLGSYIVLTAHEVLEEEHWVDYGRIKPQLENWSIENMDKMNQSVKYFLLTTSLNVFDNYKVIPFIVSIALVILTYFITIEMSNKRFAGLVAICVLLSSGIFRIYDTSIVYSNFWVFFYFFSIYLIFKIPLMSIVPFVLGLLSKPLIIMLLPMHLLFIYKSESSKKNKLIVSSTFVIFVTLGFVTFGLTGYLNFEDIDAHSFLKAITSISYQLRFDTIILSLLLPVTVGLFFLSKKIPHASSMLMLIIGTTLAQPMVSLFSPNILSEPYRFMPLVVSISISIGILFSKLPKRADELQSKKF